MITQDLSWEEFEVLHEVIKKNKIALDLLVKRLFYLTRSSLDASIKILCQKKLIRLDSNHIFSHFNTRSVLEPYRVLRAVILAAGRGERMRPLTDTTPKPMAQVQNRRLIETQIEALMVAGIDDIIVVRGYLGGELDVLKIKYPKIRFIDNHDWHVMGALGSANLAIDLLENAYLLEGDLFINNPKIIRSYEFRATYCGILEDFKNDWCFKADSNNRIVNLLFGDSVDLKKHHHYIGISHWGSKEAKQLKRDLFQILQNSTNLSYIEAIHFGTHADNYDFYLRPLNKLDVTEVDTFEELQNLRERHQNINL